MPPTTRQPARPADSLLRLLQSRSTVDCDTLDPAVARDLGPFSDCTSNQAIAFGQLTARNTAKRNGVQAVDLDLILSTIEMAKSMGPGQMGDAVPLEELAVELLMVRLAMKMQGSLTGCVHVQTNAKYAYSTVKTIQNAERIVEHFKQLYADDRRPFNPKTVCIKVPSTWHGLLACRELEQRGIQTMATIVFSMEQAALAADAGCKYIAPYVNELKVHFEPAYTDPKPAFAFCATAQQYFQKRHSRTQVVAASLTSIDQVLRLAGLAHITVSPPLLAELASTTVSSYTASDSIGDALAQWTAYDIKDDMLRDEKQWTEAFTASDHGRNEAKLVQAIGIFTDIQEKLEMLVKDVMLESS